MPHSTLSYINNEKLRKTNKVKERLSPWKARLIHFTESDGKEKEDVSRSDSILVEDINWEKQFCHFGITTLCASR